jgi:hypothetical protein
MNLDALPWKDMTTIGLAALGAGLGVMNTWNALSQRRVRLVVRPTYAVDPNGQRPTMLSIAVTNLSSFPMTINEVGYTGKARAKGGKRAVIAQPHVIDGKSWPRRLESREAVSLYFGLEGIPRDPSLLAWAYAGTECGVYAYGTSPALDQLRALAKD